MYLAVSLRGQAQSVLGNLAGGVPKKYGELITALNEQFSPPNQMELHRAQLRERKQRATDSLPELGKSIRRLTNLAYPTAPYDVRETLSKEYFIDALIDSDIRLRIKQSQPATLNDAIRQAVELEAFVKVEEKNKELKGYIRQVEVTEPEQSKTDKELQKLLSRLEELQNEMKELKSQKQGQFARQTGVYRDRQRVVCPVCGRVGHFGKDCYSKDRPTSSQGRGQVGGFQTRIPTKGSRKQSGIKRSSEKSEQCNDKAEKPSYNALRGNHIDVRLGGVSPENSLRQLQKEDKDVSTIKQLIESNSRPDTTVMSFKSSTVKALWSQRQKLVVENDLLYRKWDDEKGTILQAIVPLSERRKVLSYSHDHPTAGHLGIRKTLSKVRQSYYWPGLQQDVRHYVAGCEKCQTSKGPLKIPRAPMQIVGASRPMERIATDILGELPLTDKGNRYILVVSGYFMKWTEAFPMPNMEARTVAGIIVRERVSRFGVPSSIHSDQGRQYESQLFSEMCKVLHIKKTRTTPYHPQSDGMVEHFNKTLVRMLKSYIHDHQSDWDEQLPFLTMAYRSVEHETTGFSPNYLMLGREVSTPLDIMFEIPSSVRSVPKNQWAWSLKEKLEEACSFVRNNVPGAMLRQKSLHDLKLSWQKFN